MAKKETQAKRMMIEMRRRKRKKHKRFHCNTKEHPATLERERACESENQRLPQEVEKDRWEREEQQWKKDLRKKMEPY